jgi:hypothetical protein
MHLVLETLKSELAQLRTTARHVNDVNAWLRRSNNAFVHATRVLQYGDSYQVDDRAVYSGQLMAPDAGNSAMDLISPWSSGRRSCEDSEVPTALRMTTTISTFPCIDLPAVFAEIAEPREFIRGDRAVFQSGTAYTWTMEWQSVHWAWAAARCLCDEIKRLQVPERRLVHRRPDEVMLLVEQHFPNLPWATIAGLAKSGLLPAQYQHDDTLSAWIWEQGKACSENELLVLPVLSALA